MKKQSLTIIAIIIFLGTGALVGIKKMKDAGNNSPELSESVKNKNVTGIVQSVSGNTVSVKVAAVPGLKIPANAARTVTLTLNAGTKIWQMIPKNSAQLQKELMVYYEKMKQKESSPPEYTETKDVPLNTLAAGQTIVVVLAPGKDKMQFIASEILIMPNVEAIENTKQSAYQALIGAPPTATKISPTAK